MAKEFPEDLRERALTAFEAAYSRLVASGVDVSALDDAVRAFSAKLELPDDANLYDLVHLCLREHFEIHDSFFDSSTANHPRRTGEAYFNQNWRAQLIENNPVPRDVADLPELVEWFEPLMAVE